MGIVSDAFAIILLNEQVVTGLVTFIVTISIFTTIFKIYEHVRGD